MVAFCEDMANFGKTVIVAGLDGTFQRKGFANFLDLVPLAEHIIKLTAVCMSCFGEGSYTKRISGDTEAVEVIGGAEKYMAVCRKCYLSPAAVPSSPRVPLKALNNGEVGSNGVDVDEEEVSPPKKALFSKEDQENHQKMVV